MITLVIALLVSGGLLFLGKRLAPPFLPEKHVTMVRFAAAGTVLLFFLAAEYVGYGIPVALLVLLVLGISGLAGWLVAKERQQAVLVQAAEGIAVSHHHAEPPLAARDPEPGVMQEQSDDAAQAAAFAVETAPFDEQAAIDELIRGLRAAGEEETAAAQEPASADADAGADDRTGMESVILEVIDRTAFIEEDREAEPDVPSGEDDGEELLLSNLTALLDESETASPGSLETAYVPPAQPDKPDMSDMRRLVLQLEEIEADGLSAQAADGLEQQTPRHAKLLELEEIAEFPER
ncbi:hypothetical protein G3578_03930 [Brevibacillus sp. SYP-B805]|uniref:hypothetical protein n=1 Tax=Brevibacillus sp. SYP-B805 TaxID=1578199 RepID=UPI0013EB1E53|nr:hypothetical protein [Brevibacillus sp. SYP-B805]NGQ94324.1 hypothetical protein [Brevibacillus sp. SYP-B805]